MVIVKYPELVEVQLKILDERIAEIYQEYAKIKVRPDAAIQIKKNLQEQIKPFVDEKVRLITNCCPIYIMDRAIKESENKEVEEPKECQISEDILEGFEKFTKMIFEQGQVEKEVKNET